MKPKISSEVKNPKITLELLELSCLDDVVGGASSDPNGYELNGYELNQDDKDWLRKELINIGYGGT